MKIRTLRPSEIECRVQQVKSNGCVLLLYKDARVDQKILDETFSPMGWKREHKVMGTPVVVNEVDKYGKTKEVVKGQYFSCVVSIWDDEKKEWISKEDTGNESNTDEIKGLYSDSFKRACFNIGIGRELYSAPFIWINLDKSEVQEENRRCKLDYKVKFEVKEIEYNEDREISKLVIIDQNGKERFSYGNTKNKAKAKSNPLLEEVYKMAKERGFNKSSVNNKIIEKGFDILNFTNEAYEVMYKGLYSLPIVGA